MKCFDKEDLPGFTRYERKVVNTIDAFFYKMYGRHLEGPSLSAALRVAGKASANRLKKLRWIPVAISVLALAVMIAGLYLKATQQLPLIRR